MLTTARGLCTRRRDGWMEEESLSSAEGYKTEADAVREIESICVSPFGGSKSSCWLVSYAARKMLHEFRCGSRSAKDKATSFFKSESSLSSNVSKEGKISKKKFFPSSRRSCSRKRLWHKLICCLQLMTVHTPARADWCNFLYPSIARRYQHSRDESADGVRGRASWRKLLSRLLDIFKTSFGRPFDESGMSLSASILSLAWQIEILQEIAGDSRDTINQNETKSLFRFSINHETTTNSIFARDWGQDERANRYSCLCFRPQKSGN